MPIRRYAAQDLGAVLALCAQEGWPSFAEDPARAHRALTAPGVTTMVATDDAGRLVGFAQLQSDGEIQAHLSLIAVDAGARRRGLARELIAAALREAGGLRIDLVTDSAQDFYAALPHVPMAGYRLYPTYSGPDRRDPAITWKDGRKV
jgi:ribosomal protein S18 acetylase RimI-like enzyme